MEVYDLELPTGVHIFPGGQPTNLIPKEIAEAKSCFLDERSMWGRLESLHGTIEIRLLPIEGKESPDSKIQSLRGHFTFRAENKPHSRYEFKSFSLRISDENNLWSFSTDATREGTKVTCQSEDLAVTTKKLMTETLIQIFLLPQQALLPAFTDELFPLESSYKDPEEFFAVMAPWRKAGTDSLPKSYTFMDNYHQPYKDKAIKFKKGHLNELTLGPHVQAIYDEHTHIDNKFWLPTVMTLNREGLPTYQLHLSDVSVVMRE